MDLPEQYLLSNLVGLACGDTTGRFAMHKDHSLMLLDLYARPPLYVEFTGPRNLARRLGKFMENPERLSFCRTLMMLLLRAARGKIVLRVGRRGALGLIACLDRDLRLECGLDVGASNE